MYQYERQIETMQEMRSDVPRLRISCIVLSSMRKFHTMERKKATAVAGAWSIGDPSM